VDTCIVPRTRTRFGPEFRCRRSMPYWDSLPTSLRRTDSDTELGEFNHTSNDCSRRRPTCSGLRGGALGTLVYNVQCINQLLPSPFQYPFSSLSFTLFPPSLVGFRGRVRLSLYQSKRFLVSLLSELKIPST